MKGNEEEGDERMEGRGHCCQQECLCDSVVCETCE